ncbi:geraniol 8-hydroxylase-like [Gossypium australe]|uniref:Geraniol 8-hydroxylase-like n=1 Tax=Gossypium australe TaxID=47621 RepID=A0A5B6VIW7_9ROSI|nr:geraniol 8-hydroxylase-like [Gossypium australe]
MMRLHPPIPLLLPRKAEEDIEIHNFVVPKGARVLINAWAIGRDPNFWEEPDLFLPERFIRSTIDVKGRDFGLIPFGSGRQICPGLTLAMRMLHLTLGTLIYSFDRELEDGHDAVSCNRIIPDAIRTLRHHELALPWMPVSTTWRNHRKICNLHIFTSHRLDANQYLRRTRVEQLLADVRHSSRV